MDADEVEAANWLKANGIAGDPGAAKALFLALSLPGDYGALKVASEGDGLVVTGPATALRVPSPEGIQALRLRLQEILSHPESTRA